MFRHRFGKRIQSGFTLMELVVAMLLMVMLITVTVPFISSALGMKVRSSARQLAGTLRYVFDESVLQSSNYRVVFNLDRHTYQVEKCPGNSAILFRNADDRRLGEEQLADRIKRMEESARNGALKSPLADSALQSCTTSSDPQLIPVQLEEPVTLLGVWTPQYPEVMRGNPDGPPEDPAEEMVAVVNFVKGGHAERAYIYLSDGGDDVYTLELEPLTGLVNLFDGELEVPRDFWR